MSDEKTLATLSPSQLVSAFQPEAIPLTREALDAESQRLDDERRRLASKSRSKATAKAYETDWRVFARWCNARAATELPASPETLARYVTALTMGEVETVGPGGLVRRRPRKPATITRCLSAIRFVHEKSGHESPTKHPLIAEILDGYARTVGTEQTRSKPLTRELLGTVISACVTKPDRTSIRDAALLSLGWAGALRESEIVSLQTEHVEVVPQGILLSLPFRKTDQTGKGTLLKIHRDTTNRRLCPVVCTEVWAEHRRMLPWGYGRSQEHEALFVSMGGRTAGSPLLPVTVASILAHRMKHAGLDPAGYTGHALRAGFITSWVAAGGNLGALMGHTGHTNIATLSKYVRGTGEWEKRPWE